MLLVSNKTKNERLHTCRSCEHFVETTQSCGPLVTEAFTDSKLCGCFMPAKARLRMSKCPLDKWGAEVTAEDIESIRHMLENKRQYTNEDLVQWHNKVTGGKAQRTTCTPCNNQMFKDLKNLVQQADKES